jgi:type IV secretory pathway VirB10-like protein
MAGLSDSLTVAILLTLVFGAITFYLYSRMGQNEKRLGLLENLLLTLKMSTEASLMGPDSVEAVSTPSPLNPEDVDYVDEEQYAQMLKEVPAPPSSPSPPAAPSPTPLVSNSVEEDANANTEEAEAEAEQLLRSLGGNSSNTVRKMDTNYESMTLKELKSLAKEKGHTGIPSTKREVIDLLKNREKPENVDLEETLI